MTKIANNKVLMAESSDIYHDYRVQKEASSLASAGYDVTVLGFRSQIHEQHDNGFNFKILTLPVVSRDHRLLRNICIAFNILVINLFIVFHRVRFYHAHNTFFLLGMYIASKLHGGKFIYDGHEVQWESGKLPSLLERFFIKKTDAVINVSYGRKIAQASRYGIAAEKIKIISNYPIVKSLDVKLKEKNDVDSLRMVFSGGFNIETNRLDLLLKSLVGIPNVYLDFLAFGYGNSKITISKLINQLELHDRVKFLPLVSPSEVISVISEYDVAVDLTINPQNKISLRYCSRNKMYEALAAGLPILCSNIESYIEEFVKRGVAIGVEPEDIESIRKGVKYFINNPAKILNMKKNAINLSKIHYNWTTQEAKLVELYKFLK